MFDIRTKSKTPAANSIQHDCHALGLALILTLLIMGGVEQNPGPGRPDSSESQIPGPSFSGVTIMDIMEAIRITQLQIDGLSNKVHDLTKVITDISHDMKAASKTHPTLHLTSSERPSLDTPSPSATTAAEARSESASPVSPDITVSESWTTVASRRKRGGKTGTTPEAGAVMVGCQNVRRIAAAARDEFHLGSQVVFRSIRGGTARCVLGALHGAVACCNAVKADLVLHVGGNELAYQSVEYTLDCIAEVVKAAKHITKVRNIVMCSVPQDPSAPVDQLSSMKRADLNAEIRNLCLSEGIQFLDLRPRLNESSYHGLDKSRLNLNRSGSRNAWQMLASEVIGFLD